MHKIYARIYRCLRSVFGSFCVFRYLLSECVTGIRYFILAYVMLSQRISFTMFKSHVSLHALMHKIYACIYRSLRSLLFYCVCLDIYKVSEYVAVFGCVLQL